MIKALKSHSLKPALRLGSILPALSSEIHRVNADAYLSEGTLQLIRPDPGRQMDVVRSFNKGRFEKEYKFAVGVEKTGGGRAVGSPILSGKTFMYTESSYRTTGIRYILKDAVDKELLQSAVDQALPAHQCRAL